jgi:hypothetical protein
MSARARLGIGVILAAPLIFLYLYCLWWLNSNKVFTNADLVTQFILYTQIARVAVVVAVRKLRTSSPALVLVVMCLEMFAFAGLIGLYVFTGGSWILKEDLEIMTVWPAVVLCVAPSYWIYKLVSLTRNNGKVGAVVPWSLGLYALLTFELGATSHSSITGGFAQVSSFMLTALLHSLSLVQTPQAEVAGIPLYIALVVYASTKDAGSTSSELNPALFLALAGTVLAIALGVYAVLIGVNALIVFSVPSSVILIAIWWITRAR